MRTTFVEMRLLNDDLFIDNASYIQNGNRWGKRKTEREREKTREIG
jgi:hypothetical protein